MKIFLTGATGFLGVPLAHALAARGHALVVLSRRELPTELPGGVSLVRGDPTVAGAWQAKVAGCEAVIHLAGESIGAKRLTADQKGRVLESRVAGTRNVVAAIAAAAGTARPRVLVCANGADVYPFDDSDRGVDEHAPPGAGFLAEVCVAWQREAVRAADAGARVVVMRTGVVLGKGGALDRMVTPFKLFFGGPVGSGRQWFSWVHVDDVVGAFVFALEHDELAGAVNLVAPRAVRQKEFAQALGAALHRPSWAPVPGPMLRLAVGPLAEYLLHGRRVVPAALERAGFVFQYPTIDDALAASV